MLSQHQSLLVPVGIALVAAVAAAAQRAVPESELLAPPAPPRLAAIHSAAQADGWAPQIALLRDAAVEAYRRDKLSAAEPWFYVYQWARVFAQPESEFLPAWITAVNEARVGHANMATHYEARSQSLGTLVAAPLQQWLLGAPAFSTEFFALLSPVDHLPSVLAILQELHAADAARFRAYAHLALAIAVVYDVPPPPHWPHHQVSPAALPRRWPRPLDAFNWWIRQEQLGRTWHRLARLGPDELKFVIDAAAPAAELEWAQEAVRAPLNQLAAAYSMVRYRRDRVAQEQPVWPGATYTLAGILATGGICPDQAYFAAQVGKARGVPTLLFQGAGNDGRHAWFGFLDGNRRWQLDAGRYAEQRFVTGYTRDPQTWREISDHELQFLSENFRSLPSYRQSRVHGAFAADFLAHGDPAAAAQAARKAVNFERRNQPAWETLIAAARAERRDARVIEGLLREAALAFQRYPDLQAHYVNRVAESLRARGQTSEADAEMRRIALKNQAERGDLSVQQARATLLRAITTQPLAQQLSSYNKIVDTDGRGAGAVFFDAIVLPFVEHLLRLNHTAEAARAVERARRTLRVEPNSQLDGDFARLAKLVKAAEKPTAGKTARP